MVQLTYQLLLAIIGLAVVSILFNLWVFYKWHKTIQEYEYLRDCDRMVIRELEYEQR